MKRAGVLVMIGFAISGATVAAGETVQQEGLRITVHSQIQPFKLPRTGTAPIAVFIAGHIDTPSGALPPQLQRMTIKVNRHGLLQSEGLPTCRLAEVKALSTPRALANCGDAVVGSGRFWATIVLPDQRPYPTRGRLLVFNGIRKGHPVLFAHIFTRSPFATAFVITFAIKRIDQGPYGTELSASFPQALGDWGFVDRIKLTLKRKYQLHGSERSYFNSGCPAPSGARFTSFPLARATFSFAEDREVTLGVNKACGVRE
jgi:hypothetical protein